MAMPMAQINAELRLIAMTAAAAFAARGFQWGGFSGEAHVPDVNEIEAALRERLTTVVTESRTFTSCSGRLYLEPGTDGDLEVFLNLGTLEGFFEVEDCEACGGFGYTDLDNETRCTACEGERKLIRRASGASDEQSAP